MEDACLWSALGRRGPGGSAAITSPAVDRGLRVSGLGFRV